MSYDIFIFNFFCGTAILFSEAAAPFYVLTNDAQGVPFPLVRQNLSLHDESASDLNGHEVVSPCGPNFFLTHSLPSGSETMVGIVPIDQRNAFHLVLGRKAALSKSMTWMNSVFSTDSSCISGPFVNAPTYSSSTLPPPAPTHAFPLARE